MKKLIAIVASALTFGAYAGQENVPVTFDTSSVPVGTEVNVEADGVVVGTARTTGPKLFAALPDGTTSKGVKLAGETDATAVNIDFTAATALPLGWTATNVRGSDVSYNSTKGAYVTGWNQDSLYTDVAIDTDYVTTIHIETFAAAANVNATFYFDSDDHSVVFGNSYDGMKYIQAAELTSSVVGKYVSFKGADSQVTISNPTKLTEAVDIAKPLIYDLELCGTTLRGTVTDGTTTANISFTLTEATPFTTFGICLDGSNGNVGVKNVAITNDRDARELTLTDFGTRTYMYQGKSTLLGKYDTILIPSDCTGSAWSPDTTDLASRTLKIQKSMNLKTTIKNVTIDGSSVVVYAYSNSSFVDGATVTGTGSIRICDTVMVNGAVSITGAILWDDPNYHTPGCLKLADGATLTVAEKLADGKVTTEVANKVVAFDESTMTYSLIQQHTITVTPVDNTTMIVMVNGEEVTPEEDNTIKATDGSTIVVTYSAAEGYIMTDKTATITATESTTVAAPEGTTPVQAVAKIGDNYYATLQKAIDAANNDDVVYLIANTTESILNNKKDLTLHINEGVTLTGTVYYYTIFNGGHTMTIEGEGTIKAGGTKPAGQLYIALYNSGTMYVKGCTVESANHVIYENAADKTVVTGGKFTKTPAPWLGRGCIATQTADKKYYTVEQLSYIAKIGETEYDSLQAAIDAVKEGEMIDLVCATDEMIDFNKDFVVAIKNNGNNYGTITGAMGVWERWTAQYSNVANYVVVSKSMEDLVEHVTTNLAKYSGIHGRFYIYDDWKLARNVTIPTVNDLSQSIFTIKDTFTLDLNGFALEQAAVVNSHGGYPTIVANYGKKVTIKDSSEAQTGILCGIGWAVDIYDDPKTCVTLESGTITTHGKVSTSVADMRGRVIRIMGGKFIMNGGAITLAHLIPGNQIFGIITASTAVASTPQIELNGGYVECAKPEQLWNEDGSNPNCLIGGSKGPTSEVEITGGSFSIVPPTDYFAEGLAAVVDENGHFHIQQVVHEGEEVTIAVSGDGEKLAPAVPEEGSVEIIAPDKTQVYVIDIAKQEAPAALYQVVTKDAEGEVVSTSNIGVVKVQEAVAVKKTIAVAVPFTGATVENLLNTALLNEGDTVMAYVDGDYKVWELAADKTWQARAVTRESGTEMSPDASKTPLNRGQAVWVTTAGQVVTFGTYEDSEAEIELEDGHNLLGNTKLVEASPEAAETEQIQLIGEEEGVSVSRYNKTSTGWVSKIQKRTLLPNGKWVTTEETGTAAPKVKPGRGYWRIKPAAK